MHVACQMMKWSLGTWVTLGEETSCPMLTCGIIPWKCPSKTIFPVNNEVLLCRLWLQLIKFTHFYTKAMRKSLPKAYFQLISSLASKGKQWINRKSNWRRLPSHNSVSKYLNREIPWALNRGTFCVWKSRFIHNYMKQFHNFNPQGRSLKWKDMLGLNKNIFFIPLLSFSSHQCVRRDGSLKSRWKRKNLVWKL